MCARSHPFSSPAQQDAANNKGRAQREFEGSRLKGVAQFHTILVVATFLIRERGYLKIGATHVVAHFLESKGTSDTLLDHGQCIVDIALVRVVVLQG